MTSSSIPKVDLLPFLKEGDDEGKKKAMEIIGEACSEYGFFQVVNHGVPLGLMRRALELSKVFFQIPFEEKIKLAPKTGAPLPAGYSRQPDHSLDKNEYLLMFPPTSSFNVYPTHPPEFKYVFSTQFYTFLCNFMNKT